VKEAAVKASADNLRQMAKHINSANEALHRAHAASGY
jgi:cellobiose-specific phosphotransferase system component IIA